MKVYPCGVVIKCFLLILLGILMVPMAAFAQTAQQLGEITGTVSNALGQNLPGARIILSASEGK
jgi:hypothetical protein